MLFVWGRITFSIVSMDRDSKIIHKHKKFYNFFFLSCYSGINLMFCIILKIMPDKGGKIMLLHLQQKDFEKEVLQSKQPVLVDFSAKWCNPCQMMGPVMEQLADDFEEKQK